MRKLSGKNAKSLQSALLGEESGCGCSRRWNFILQAWAPEEDGLCAVLDGDVQLLPKWEPAAAKEG